MTDKLIRTGIIATAVVAIVFMVYLTLQETKVAFASAPSGLPATETIATTTLVGPQQNIQLFAKSGTCSSRVVTTVGSGIMLIFADPSGGDVSSTTLSGQKGFLQAASTTVAYDSGIYGCGRVFGYGFSSTTINLMETQ